MAVGPRRRLYLLIVLVSTGWQPSFSQIVKDCSTLYRAIGASNAGFVSGPIMVQSGVTINLSDCVGSTTNFNGLPTLSSDFSIQGMGPPYPIINGNGKWPIFTVAQGNNYYFNVSVSNLKLMNAAPNQNAYLAGSCIYLSSYTNAVISNVIFQGCTGALGGAIYSWGGSVTVNNSTFTGNSAIGSGGEGTGGAIYMYNQLASQRLLLVSTSTFTQNTANPGQASQPAKGGAIYSGVPVIVSFSSFSSNAANSPQGSSYGGAIFLDGNNAFSFQIITSSFSSNAATGVQGFGGVLWTSNKGSIAGCQFVGNAALAAGIQGSNGYAQGGVLFSQYYDATKYITITDSYFSSNYVIGPTQSMGGAIYLWFSLVEARNGFVNNSALLTWGMQQPVSAYGGAVYCPNTQASFNSSYSLYANNSATSFTGDANGGAVAWLGVVYALSSNFTRNSAFSNCALGCSYLNNAPSGGGGALYAYMGLYSFGCSFSYNQHVVTGWGSTAAGGAVYMQNYGATGLLTLDTCTFTTNTAACLYCPSYGGAVFMRVIYSATAYVNNCQFSQSNATGQSASGGAISVFNGPLSVSNSGFTRSLAAATGGGDALGGAIDNRQSPASLSVHNSTFLANSATSAQGNARGGAIYTGYSSATSYSHTFARLTFTNNSAVALQNNANGGALYAGTGYGYLTATVSACSFDGSAAVGAYPAGGAIFAVALAYVGFCRTSTFGKLYPNVKMLAPGSTTIPSGDIDAAGAVLKFCPQININVDTNLNFVPIQACDLCSCNPRITPCDPRATCSVRTIPQTYVTALYCACPAGVKGNGFVCGNILSCNS